MKGQARLAIGQWLELVTFRALLALHLFAVRVGPVL